IGIPPVSVPLAYRPGNPPILNPLWMQLGKLQVRTFGAANGTIGLPGAPMRINCQLRLPGDIILSADRRNGESILVNGKIVYEEPADPTVAAVPPRFYDPETGAQPPENALPAILESDNGNYTSFGGLVRDESGNPDAQGYARA